MKASAAPSAGSPTQPMKTPMPQTAAFLARRAHLIALAIFAVVGLFVIDDYGITPDELPFRISGNAAFDYVLGDESALLPPDKTTGYYGVAFDIPLIAAERIFRPEDTRSIYLSRRLLTHALFLVGGFFAWLLAYRMFGNRLVALLVMSLFLLHPRIYAHSFFNGKDLPFLSMFMVSLYLTHRAFRRDSVWAFALCGASVALMANIRVIGLMLIPAVLGMLALDAVFAARRGEWGIGIGRIAKPALANAAAFSAAFAAVFYAVYPMMWRAPFALLDQVRVMSSHPGTVPTRFRGEIVQYGEIPWDYIPAWMLITTPPVAFALAALGIAAVVWLCAANWRGMFANSDARFGLLALACLILPVAAAIAFVSNLYGGWRQMYFLYAPICVLSAFGLWTLAEIPKPRFRAGALALAALGIAAAAVQTVSLHPIQDVYFNPLANKNNLAKRWEVSYWKLHYKEAMEAMLKMQPAGRFAVSFGYYRMPDHFLRNLQIFPEDDRREFVGTRFPMFQLVNEDVGDAAAWTSEAYGSPLISIIDLRTEFEADFRATRAAARASGPVAHAGGFDIYRDADALIYAKENCAERDTLGTFQLTTIASHRGDSPTGERRGAGMSFDFWRYGAELGGDCLIAAPLPEYPLHAVEIRKLDAGGGELVWRTVIPLADSLADYAAALSALPANPAASAGGFDIYARDGALIYVKSHCAESDARGRFALSIFPSDRADLPQSARDAGADHAPLNFDFPEYGVALDGKCVIIRDLPGYPIAAVETGQWIPGGEELWSVRIVVSGQ